ncbi:3-hydroxyacyl-CoA dehydrogenase NAD-binding domain-containing protein [Specibacter sp. RAF43]|uniref:3-hydroxyacyl-CoA dehydrogenase n=1 Tax=Specibacter sp. RAF43 TaxID=3233057 RepID=UPI003F96BD20
MDTVAVIGAGTMGGGIAMNFLNAGRPVKILETKQEALERGIGVIRRNYQAQVDKGKLTSDVPDQRMKLLSPTLNYADIADCDLVIEAVFEDMDVKRAVLTQLDDMMKPGAILASNTSTLDVAAIAAITTRPADVLGMRFFSPANVMALLEVVRGIKTADNVLAIALAIALAVGQRVGKTAVVSGVCEGFIGSRMLAKYSFAPRDLLESVATPIQIDSAMEDFGLAMGPFRMADLAGNDIVLAIRKRHYAEQPDARRDEITDTLCEMGRFGQKTGAGWYDYEQGRRDAMPSPVVDWPLASFHKRNQTLSRTFEPDEIVQRLIFALADEGARILEEGIALRASDIDVVYTSGCDFPRHRGGPMLYADTVGLDTVLSQLCRFTPAEWEPAPLLVRLAAEGKAFNHARATKDMVDVTRLPNYLYIS